MLRVADRPVEKLELMTWCFLLRHESPSQGGSAFFDFLPYHYGPYSFCLSREMETLVSEGMVRESEKTWELTSSAAEEFQGLSAHLREESQRVVRRFRGRTLEHLLDYVYVHFPAFTVNSKRERLATRPVAQPQIYTAGYEGLQIDGFLNLLVKNGIQRILDVRNNPIARRFGFHKSTLQRLTKQLDIEYVHLPELGIRSKLRQDLQTASDYEKLFLWYEKSIRETQAVAIQRTADLIAAKSSVLICMEADPVMCHRTRLAHEIHIRTHLPIIDLGQRK